MNEQYFLVAVQATYPDGSIKFFNARTDKTPGTWYAEFKGNIMEDNPVHYTFLSATPLTKEEYEALNDLIP